MHAHLFIGLLTPIKSKVPSFDIVLLNFLQAEAGRQQQFFWQEFCGKSDERVQFFILGTKQMTFPFMCHGISQGKSARMDIDVATS